MGCIPQEMLPLCGTEMSAAQTQRTPLQRNRQDHLSSRLRAYLSSATKGTGTFDELPQPDPPCVVKRARRHHELSHDQWDGKKPTSKHLACTAPRHTKKTVEKPLVFFRKYRCQTHFEFFYFSEKQITIIKERIWINRVSSEIMFSVFASRHCPVAR